MFSKCLESSPRRVSWETQDAYGSWLRPLDAHQNGLRRAEIADSCAGRSRFEDALMKHIYRSDPPDADFSFFAEENTQTIPGLLDRSP